MMLLNLIAQLEKATEGSRELDVRIHGFIEGWSDSDIEHAVSVVEAVNVPPRSSSIDAALSLVPEGWTAEINWREAFDKGSSCVLHEFPEPCRRIPEKHPYVIQGATPALSICIAALRARSAGKG